MCVIGDLVVTVFSIPLRWWTCGLVSHPRGWVESKWVGYGKVGSKLGLGLNLGLELGLVLGIELGLRTWLE